MIYYRVTGRERCPATDSYDQCPRHEVAFHSDFLDRALAEAGRWALRGVEPRALVAIEVRERGTDELDHTIDPRSCRNLMTPAAAGAVWLC